jgi:hypothetical protein
MQMKDGKKIKAFFLLLLNFIGDGVSFLVK